MSLFFTCFILEIFYDIRITSLPTSPHVGKDGVSDEDKILIKNVSVDGYKSMELMNKFSNKC